MLRPKTRVAVLVLLLAVAGQALAQSSPGPGPTINPGAARNREQSSSLGRPPGQGGPLEEGAPSGDLLSGRAGPSFPRVPVSITQPAVAPAGRRPLGIARPASRRIGQTPIYGTLGVPPATSDEGPPGGLTLDAAIERLVHENLDLRAQAHELSQADADILTAGLRANPIFYADSQLVPYGNYSRARPGGPTQYDVNVTYPVDISGKRRARLEVARRAKRVLEAQYQDAVRLQIDNLYEAYVDLLAAREAVRYAREGVRGLDQVVAELRDQRAQGIASRGDVNQVRIQRESAAIGLADAEEAYLKAKRALGPLLRLTPLDAEGLEPRGTIRDLAPTPPPEDNLVRLALAERPDLVSYRLGVLRAEADVGLARADRVQDVYVLYQPYTYQNNAPYGTKGATSWALGVTVPLPISNRNQGNIRRARLNVDQTRTEMAALELRVVTEVRQAVREYAVTRASVEKVERELLPFARQVVDEALKAYRLGEGPLLDYLNARREYNEIIRQFRDTAIRHRRAMLALNTAVGRRLLP
jgi:cobalt-zinc-cadmium efflux system outer membrane protein